MMIEGGAILPNSVTLSRDQGLQLIAYLQGALPPARLPCRDGSWFTSVREGLIKEIEKQLDLPDMDYHDVELHSLEIVKF